MIVDVVCKGMDCNLSNKVIEVLVDTDEVYQCQSCSRDTIRLVSAPRCILGQSTPGPVGH